MTAVITSVRGRRVWDSRGRPTVEAEVVCGQHIGRAIAPAGASTGSAEAVERRDGGAAFGGYDVRAALANIDGTIAEALTGHDSADQRALDAVIAALGASDNFASIGGNAATAVSMACAHAAASVGGVPLWEQLLRTAGRPSDHDRVVVPLPEIQIFGGGAHAGGRIDIQDLMVMAPGASSFAEALDWTAEIYRTAGGLMPVAAGVADEGGWWPSFDTNEHAIETLARSVEHAGFSLGRDVVLSLDIAASELWHDGRYRLALDGSTLDTDAMSELVARWCADYCVASVEDPLGEHDVAGMRAFTQEVSGRVQVVGDDIYATNATRVAELEGVATALLVKVNQAGTLTGAFDAVTAAAARGIRSIVSARSGETEDVTIAHLAVGWQAGQLKVGSMTRGERTAKWNEMIRIEHALGARAEFAGWHPLPARSTPADLIEEEAR
jgi:enolase